MAMLNSRTIVLPGTVVNGTAAYAAGDQVGAAVAYTGWAVATNTCNIMDVDITQLSGYAGALDLHFWRTSPTVVADNAAGTYTIADWGANHLGLVKIATTDWTAVGNMFNYTKPSTGISLQGNAGTIFMTVIAQGTPTYTAASHIIVNLGLLQDG